MKKLNRTVFCIHKKIHSTYNKTGRKADIRISYLLFIFTHIFGGDFLNYTYMVKCSDGTLYTGWTNNLNKRLKAHNEGDSGAKYTKLKRPVSLVYYEGFATKEEAMRREYQIKQLTRKQKLALIDF